MSPNAALKDPGIGDRIYDHIVKYGSDLSFTNHFWKRCEPHPYELKRYPLYVECLLQSRSGKSVIEISRTIGVKPSSLRNWIRFEQMPKLAHYLELFLRLGRPKSGWVWLSINNSPGHAVPVGPVTQVPETISAWYDVEEVVRQLESLDGETHGFTKEYLFGFLVGMVIGDSAKSKSENWHRHLGLVLSKRYATNEKIGDFTCVCARSLGLRMHRVADQPKPRRKPNGFYQWVSQASPLVDWIFNVVLGLKDGERTTYDSVRMEWAIDSPEDFRRGLVQGIAESDGSVSIASQTVEFWIGPNWDLFKEILRSFGVESFRNREALSVAKRQIQNLAAIPPFAPNLRTMRFIRFQKLANAKHIGHGKRIPSEIKRFISKSSKSLSIPRLSEMVLDRYGVILSFEAVQRWGRNRVE